MDGALVVGYDGLPGGDAALDEAIALAKAVEGTRLLLVFAYEPPARVGGEVADLREILRRMGEDIEARAHERVSAAGVEHELILIDARPAQGLAQVAEDHDARMIIVGGAGEAPLTGAILGSVPHKLLHLTDRPVLVVRGTT